MWTDLWMHTVGFIFFLVWSICISEYYSRLFNQKEWAIKDVYCANRKGGYFKTAFFANIDWSFSHLKSPALSNKCLLNHIQGGAKLGLKSASVKLESLSPLFELSLELDSVLPCINHHSHLCISCRVEKILSISFSKSLISMLNRSCAMRT